MAWVLLRARQRITLQEYSKIVCARWQGLRRGHERGAGGEGKSRGCVHDDETCLDNERRILQAAHLAAATLLELIDVPRHTAHRRNARIIIGMRTGTHYRHPDDHWKVDESAPLLQQPARRRTARGVTTGDAERVWSRIQEVEHTNTIPQPRARHPKRTLRPAPSARQPGEALV